VKRWFTKEALPPEEIERQCPYPIVVSDALDQSKILLSYADEDDRWVTEWMSSIGFTASDVFVEPPSFGSRLAYAEEPKFAQTTSAKYVEHVVLQQTELSAGVYRVGWSFEWWGSNTSTDFMARILLDGQTISQHRRRPINSSSTTRDTVSGFHHAVLSQGDHTLSLEFCTSDNRRAVGIENARLECWRVG